MSNDGSKKDVPKDEPVEDKENKDDENTKLVKEPETEE